MKKDICSECPQCTGTGQEWVTIGLGDNVQREQITCRRCNGDTKVSNQCLDDDLIDMLEDMKDKIYDIFEKVNE